MRPSREIMAEMAAGLTPAQLLLMAELLAATAAEALRPAPETPEERRKRLGRERSQRHRASQSVTDRYAEAENDTVTERHETSPRNAPASPLARGVDNPLKLVSTGGLVVVGDAREVRDADDWPAGDTRKHAKLLVEHADTGWLDPDKSHKLVSSMGRIHAWRKAGASWLHDVLPVVSALTANRRSAVGSWTFFDGAIAQSIADNRAALAIPEADSRPRSTGPPQSYSERANAVQEVAIKRLLGEG